MNREEFDRFADEYHQTLKRNIRFSGEDPTFFHEYKILDVASTWAAAQSAVPGPQAILDFGTGIGSSLVYFEKHLPKSFLVGLDVSGRSLEIAKGRTAKTTELVQFDGTTLPFRPNSFDIVFAACVFHHIPHEFHLPILQELKAALRPNGMLFVFEHNPLNPLTTHAVRTCPFDVNARLISARTMRANLERLGLRDVGLRYRIFFPGPLAVLRPLERFLSWLPFGAQYFVHGRGDAG